LHVRSAGIKSGGEAQAVKMAAGGKDHHFRSYAPCAQVNAVDFRAVGILAFLNISMLKGRFTL